MRSELECEEVGKVKGSINVPWVILKRVYDPEAHAKVVKKELNKDFAKLVSSSALWTCMHPHACSCC